MQLLGDAKAPILLVLLMWVQLKVMAAGLRPSSRSLHHSEPGLSVYIMLRLILVCSSCNSDSSCVRRVTGRKTCQAWLCTKGRRGSSCRKCLLLRLLLMIDVLLHHSLLVLENPLLPYALLLL